MRVSRVCIRHRCEERWCGQQLAGAAVLHLQALGTEEERAAYHELAAANLQRWRAAAPVRAPAPMEVRVLPGDWGEVTQALVAEWGTPFAVLNMANAYIPGGGYVEGCPAQEENE